MTQQSSIPQPPGTKYNPIKRAARVVDPNHNTSIIVGIPNEIVKLVDLTKGTTFDVYVELRPEINSYRIVYEKVT